MNENFPLSVKMSVALNHLCSKFSFFFKVKKKSLFILLPSPPAYPLKSHKSCFILILALWLCWHLPPTVMYWLYAKITNDKLTGSPLPKLPSAPPLLKLAIIISMMKRHFVWRDVCLYKCGDSSECSTVCYDITVTKMMKLVSDVPSLC